MGLKTNSFQGGYILPLNWLASASLFINILPNWWLQVNWNPPAWSLGVEMVFYLTYPLVAAYLLPVFKRSRAWVIVLFIALVLLLQTLLIVAGVNYAYQEMVEVLQQGRWLTCVLFENPLIRLFEFVIGCLLGLLFIKRTITASDTRNNNSKIVSLLVTTLLVLMGCIAAYPSPAGFTGLLLYYARLYVLYVPIFATIIYCVACNNTILNYFCERPLLVLLGEASFSLYLLHWPCLLVAEIALHSFNGLAPVPIVGGACLAAIVLSIPLYRLVEIPWRKRLRGQRREAVRR